LRRREGFGLGLAEAMLLGKVVIATNWSGNLQFMTADNSLLIDYQLVEIDAALAETG
jgi:glycosyltransferase involved in cell wall biosynthesis